LRMIHLVVLCWHRGFTPTSLTHPIRPWTSPGLIYREISRLSWLSRLGEGQSGISGIVTRHTEFYICLLTGTWLLVCSEALTHA
jgi:hypothetical protein